MFYVDRDKEGKLSPVFVPTPREKEAMKTFEVLPTEVANLQTQLADLTAMVTEIIGGMGEETDGVTAVESPESVPKATPTPAKEKVNPAPAEKTPKTKK